MEIKFMEAALKEAEKAKALREIPVGAVVVKDGEIIAAAHNLRETEKDSTAHAEVLALRAACKALERWNLSDCDLYVTLEPCMMCAGAIVYSRIKNVFFGAHDLRFGCCGTVCNLAGDERFNHRANVTGGIMEETCVGLIKEFFQKLRKGENPAQ